MNFYKHHIGDYDQATRHLTFVEDAAYSRMVRKYYAEERPLPVEIKKIQKLIGARTNSEKSAVESVLQEFFVLQDDGWHQQRCDEELEAATAKATKNREVGKLGGRPRKTETQQEPTDNPNGYLFETQTVSENNPSQTPDTRHQTPDSKTVLGSASVPDREDDNDRLPPRALLPATKPDNRAIGICTLLTGAGITKVTAFHPDVAVTWAQDERVTDMLLLAAVKRARETKGDQPIQITYLKPIIVELLNPPEAKPSKPKSDDWEWKRSDGGIERKGREMGMFARGGESHRDFAGRIDDEIRKRKGPKP